jgi:hypothetical protein
MAAAINKARITKIRLKNSYQLLIKTHKNIYLYIFLKLQFKHTFHFFVDFFGIS